MIVGSLLWMKVTEVSCMPVENIKYSSKFFVRKKFRRIAPMQVQKTESSLSGGNV
jgi:hypothetical protein